MGSGLFPHLTYTRMPCRSPRTRAARRRRRPHRTTPRAMLRGAQSLPTPAEHPTRQGPSIGQGSPNQSPPQAASHAPCTTAIDCVRYTIHTGAIPRVHTVGGIRRRLQRNRHRAATRQLHSVTIPTGHARRGLTLAPVSRSTRNSDTATHATTVGPSRSDAAYAARRWSTHTPSPPSVASACRTWPRIPCSTKPTA